MQIQLNREGDPLDGQDTPLLEGRDINREDDLIIERDTRPQVGRDIDSKGNLLTALIIGRQAGQVTKGEDNIIIEQDTPHLEGRDINRGEDLILDVMDLPLQAGRNIDQEGTLPNVLHLHLQGEGVIDREAPLLVNTKAQVADDTTGHQVAQCGENHQHLETLHSNKTVYVVGIPIQVWSVPTMRTIEDPHVVIVTYNTPQRVIRSGGAGLPTETTNRWVV